MLRTAQELGVNRWTLRDRLAAPARSTAELGVENVRLRAGLARVTEPRDILKKSLGILSHP